MFFVVLFIYLLNLFHYHIVITVCVTSVSVMKQWQKISQKAHGIRTVGERDLGGGGASFPLKKDRLSMAS